MKKILLATSVLFSASAFAQFTQGNEPAIGASETYFRMDNTAPEYASNTGSSAMWDYSGVAGQGMTSTRDLNVVDATATTHASDFPTSVKAFDLGDYIITYVTSSSTSRNSQGFYFDDGTTQITAKFPTSGNDEILMSYPLSFGNSGTDAFTGTATVSALSGQSLPANGSVTYGYDGVGTLKLNSTTTLTNISRYKVAETVTVTTPFGTATMTRTQYEYYDILNSMSHLPVFIWSKITITFGGSPSTTMSVLSNTLPDHFLSLDNNELTNVNVYPNPAKEKLFVSGMDTNGSITVVDVAGQTVKSVDAAAGTTEISVSDLKAGVYLVKVTSEKGTKTQRVVVQ